MTPKSVTDVNLEPTDASHPREIYMKTQFHASRLKIEIIKHYWIIRFFTFILLIVF